MYVPEYFKEDDPERIEALIRAHSFGLLISVQEGLPCASHLPFLYDRSAGGHGKLIGHMARSNPQWNSLAHGQKVLAIFQGPHAYVSPAWYSMPGVPTWNYAVAHLYGLPRLIEDEGALEGIVQRLTAVHESMYREPWIPHLSGERWSRLLGMIIGFEIEVTEIQGKFKLSQNRPLDDQRRVIEQLERSGSQLASGVARLMAANLDGKF
jgi:transcriptional regulator